MVEVMPQERVSVSELSLRRAYHVPSPRNHPMQLGWYFCCMVVMREHRWPLSTVLWLQGDARDWALMWTSVAIFVYASMHLYRLYAYAYYSLGLRPLTHLLGH